VICRASSRVIYKESCGRAVTLEINGMRGSANTKGLRNASKPC
jgi:hypothetical protein